MQLGKSCSYILVVVTVLISLHYLGTDVLSIDTLKAGDELNSSSRLVSQNGLFALGFFTAEDTNNTYLSIWYTSSPSDPVWMANREDPFLNTSAPVLSVGDGGELVITGGGKRPFVVYGGGSGQNAMATATLLNTGNFVVNSSRNSSSGGDGLGWRWQSFDYPTDSFLPGMKLGLSHRTGKKWALSSWLSPRNPAPGAFTMEWDPISRRLLVKRRGVLYWTSGGVVEYNYAFDGKRKIIGETFENFVLQIQPQNVIYNMSSVSNDEEEYVRYSVRSPAQPWAGPPGARGTDFAWWTLDYQGNLLDHSDGNFFVMADECYGYTIYWLGPYMGCEIRDVPEFRNRSVKFELRLGDFRPINGTSADLSVRDANSSLSESDCRDFCWNDRDCVGYVKSHGDGCVYWRGRDSEFHPNLDGSNMEIKRYVLVSTSSSSTKGKKKHIQIIIIGVVVGSVVLITLVIPLFILHRIKKGKGEAELHNLLTLEGYTEMLENEGAKNHDLKLFTYASIVTATSNFSQDNKLGQGGFGPVYKGRTAEGQDIAVKVLSRQSGQGLLEFKTELILISKLQHVNLVKLQGFCIHGDDKMIIYDYMHNKSLDFFLFSESKREQLDWKKRFNIIEGIAHGLLYLHKYSRLRIIHRDLKPSNILLDEDMNPKISDFGLARIFKHNVSEANTNRRVGTYGYMAPEYAMRGLFSDKSDVYSFGVLVLEIVIGRKINSFHEIGGPLSIVEYAWELLRKDCAVEFMDPALKDSCIVDQLQRCFQIGLLCVENLAVDRPAIEDVVSMLKNEASSLPMPKNPAFITRNSVLQLEEKSFPPENLSANEATISEVQGR